MNGDDGRDIVAQLSRRLRRGSPAIDPSPTSSPLLMRSRCYKEVPFTLVYLINVLIISVFLLSSVFIWSLKTFVYRQRFFFFFCVIPNLSWWINFQFIFLYYVLYFNTICAAHFASNWTCVWFLDVAMTVLMNACRCSYFPNFGLLQFFTTMQEPNDLRTCLVEVSKRKNSPNTDVSEDEALSQSNLCLFSIGWGVPYRHYTLALPV